MTGDETSEGVALGTAGDDDLTGSAYDLVVGAAKEVAGNLAEPARQGRTLPVRPLAK